VFSRICWDLALEEREAAVVVNVDQGLARALRGEGIISAEDLLARHSEETLAALERFWGVRTQKVGMKRARSVLLHAKALLDGRHILLRRPSLPPGPNLVMFDLEGLPPYMDELDKIYLWGMKVYGLHPHPFMPAVAPIAPDGDRIGWERFLANCERLFSEYGDIPFVHWASYEKTKVRLYLERYGDRDGLALRVLENLVDLLPIAKASVVIPEPSYSLKCVEREACFQRTQTEYGGTWAMAKYIEAVEAADDTLRQEIMGEILTYNEEDLEATWAVYQWLEMLSR
jgi:predicted RecB family nuclease